MYDIMRGVRIVELASWTFVPAAGAVLADWGADVIKIEHPATGDPQRGLFVSALGESAPDIMIEQPNRGKRSVALDIGTPEGRKLLYRLVAEADVFLTNFRAPAMLKQEIGVEHLRRHNPNLIYVRGTG